MPDRSDGRRLGRYVIRRRLGAGGFARVYLAFDPDLEFEVALKVLKPQFADDPAAVERFRREATTAVRLRHPNVVTVLAVGRLDEEFDGTPVGAPYLVMDYLPDSLGRRLTDSPSLPEPELRRIGAEVARGLAYAHQAGVVHRDVKPDNILFGRDGQAVVTDFGIARAVADTLAPATRSAVVGTPSYFSPEQARGLPLDGRTDIYALGVTLYQGATGELPFVGDDWYAVMRQHVEDPPVPPSERNPALTPDLDAIVLRCLEKEPASRHASAADLADALARPGAARTGGRPAIETPQNHETVVVDPFVARRASASLGPAAGDRGRRWLASGGVVGAIAAATAIAAIVRSASSDVAPLPGPTQPAGIESTGSSVMTAPPGAIFNTPIDALADSALRPAPAPLPGGLIVSAPGGTLLRVNGTAVGRAPWAADTLRAGRYTVRATLPAARGCPSAETSETVQLAEGERRQLRLTPRGCGTLTIVGAPPGATYTLVPRGGGARREGRLPLPGPILLPEGRYQLTVGAPTCSDFDGVVEVSAGGAETKRAPLICG